MLTNAATDRRLRLAQQIANAHKLSYQKIDLPQQGYRNLSFKVHLSNGTAVNLMIFKTEADSLQRIKRADSFSYQLAKVGLPVRHRLDSPLVEISSKSTKKSSFAALYSYLPGKTISWEAYTMNHLKLLGQAMAAMHTVWRQLSNSKHFVYPELLNLIQRMEMYFDKSGVSNALLNKLNTVININFAQYRDLLGSLQNLPTQHGLHMDFVRGNVLFNEASEPSDESLFKVKNLKLSGIIDFEKAGLGHPLLDVARTLAFLLVDCKYKTPDKIKKYFLYSGYKKHGQLSLPDRYSDENVDRLALLVQFFLLHDFYKFLKHNPYEYLAQNEHYVRTRDILVAQGVIKYDL